MGIQCGPKMTLASGWWFWRPSRSLGWQRTKETRPARDQERACRRRLPTTLLSISTKSSHSSRKDQLPARQTGKHDCGKCFLNPWRWIHHCLNRSRERKLRNWTWLQDRSGGWTNANTASALSRTLQACTQWMFISLTLENFMRRSLTHSNLHLTENRQS